MKVYKIKNMTEGHDGYGKYWGGGLYGGWSDNGKAYATKNSAFSGAAWMRRHYRRWDRATQQYVDRYPDIQVIEFSLTEVA